MYDFRLAIICLGYVGLPLATEFGEKYPTIGFDINRRRIAELESGHARTREPPPDELTFTADTAPIPPRPSRRPKRPRSSRTPGGTSTSPSSTSWPCSSAAWTSPPVNVHVFDPHADPEDVKLEYGLERLKGANGVIYDVKNSIDQADGRR